MSDNKFNVKKAFTQIHTAMERFDLFCSIITKASDVPPEIYEQYNLYCGTLRTMEQLADCLTVNCNQSLQDYLKYEKSQSL